MLVEIVRPKLELVPSFLEFKEALGANGDSVWDPYFPALNESHSDFVKRQLDRTFNPTPNLVPETVYWGIVDHVAVGRISIRHHLNENLKKMGGHIGYEVHPGYRRRGIATEMLRAILQTPKAIEIGKLLLTCKPDNVGSNKTILSNGGVLEKRAFVESLKEDRNYYWIHL